MHERPQLGRAALVGLASGLGLAAVALTLSALGRLRVDCAGLLPTECAFEETLAGDVARPQLLGALGCALVAAGLFLWARRRRATRAPLR